MEYLLQQMNKPNAEMYRNESEVRVDFSENCQNIITEDTTGGFPNSFPSLHCSFCNVQLRSKLPTIDFLKFCT